MGVDKADKKVVDLFNPNLDEALRTWRSLLSEERVVTGDDLVHYDNCPSQAKRRVCAALLPVSTTEISEIVRCANINEVPLYPVSKGKNWGYGGANPFVDNCVIVDLSKMNKILDFCPDLGVITIEPGVTQGQIAEFLSENNHPFMISTIVAGPNCSYVGNALERGFGMIPPRDRFASLTSLKAVLPDGSFYQPLMADAGGELTDKVYKWGVGPYIDGLFSQGNFGIVTQASFTLARVPEKITRFYFSPKPDASMESMVNVLRFAKQRLAGSMNSFEFGTRTKAVYQDGSLEEDLSDWVVYGSLHTTKRVAKAVIKDMKDILKPVFTDFVFLDHDKLGKRPWVYRRSRNWTRIVTNLKKVKAYSALYRGIPDDMHLEYAFQSKVKLNPEQSLEEQLKKSGYIFFRPVIPAQGVDVLSYIGAINAVAKKYGITPGIDMSLSSEAHIVAGTNIIFDPETQLEEANAMHKELFELCKALGYVPHRAHIDAMDWFVDNDESEYCQALEKLKKAFDPNNIISPGKWTKI